jgi:hypothetical protein
MFGMILLGTIVIVVAYGVMIYNGLVLLKHAVAKAWANIDVLLKQRHDELHKLVEVCMQHKQFEQSTLQKVIEARSQMQARITSLENGIADRRELYNEFLESKIRAFDQARRQAANLEQNQSDGLTATPACQ